MALTPDDVVTKQFQHVRFKEGFDPDEVDDFLDEIVVEWRKTIAENEELKAKLAAYESGTTPAPTDDAVAEETPEEAAEPQAEVVEEAPAGASASEVATSAGIIELAQRLYAEHVAEGESKRDAMIAEGESKRDSLISEAEEKAAKIIADAQATSRSEIARLTVERDDLQTRVGELRQFESDYRSQLRAFIEEKLSDLDTTGADTVAPAGE